MNTITTIHTRRSIRSFNREKVNKELLEEILSSATQAPFAMSLGGEPWRFVVIEGDKKDEFTRLLETTSGRLNDRKPQVLKPNIKVIKEAPVIILAFGIYRPGQHKANHFDIHAISASIQNMLLSATSLGLGSLWIGAVCFAKEEICKWAHQDYLVGGVALGYTDDTSQKLERKSWQDVTMWLK